MTYLVSNSLKNKKFKLNNKYKYLTNSNNLYNNSSK